MLPFNSSEKRVRPAKKQNPQVQVPAYSVKPQRMSAASMFKTETSNEVVKKESEIPPSASNDLSHTGTFHKKDKRGKQIQDQEKLILQKKVAWLNKSNNKSINTKATQEPTTTTTSETQEKGFTEIIQKDLEEVADIPLMKCWNIDMEKLRLYYLKIIATKKPEDEQRLNIQRIYHIRKNRDRTLKNILNKGTDFTTVKDIDPKNFETAELNDLKLYLQKLTYQMKIEDNIKDSLKYKNLLKKAQPAYCRRIAIKKKRMMDRKLEFPIPTLASQTSKKNVSKQSQMDLDTPVPELTDTPAPSTTEGSPFKTSAISHSFKLTLKPVEDTKATTSQVKKLSTTAPKNMTDVKPSAQQAETRQIHMPLENLSVPKTDQSAVLQTQQSTSKYQQYSLNQSQLPRSEATTSQVDTQPIPIITPRILANVNPNAQQAEMRQLYMPILNLSLPKTDQNALHIQQSTSKNQQFGLTQTKISRAEAFGYNPLYPKGVPRSFLEQQYENKLVSDTNWPTFSGPAFMPPYSEPIHDLLATTSQQMYGQFHLDIPSNPVPMIYSPTEDYSADITFVDAENEMDTVDLTSPSRKRVSAFERLGPAAAAAAAAVSTSDKKPKLTINLLFSKDTAGVREVIDDHTVASHVPVHERRDIAGSSDRTVIKYLSLWPWTKALIRRTAVQRNSKTVMLMELEKMSEGYESTHNFIKVAVTNYPPYFKKEDVLDIVLDEVKEKSLIPCFIEFTPEECYFLVLRSRSALHHLHQSGLEIRRGEIRLIIAISLVDINVSHLDFIPRLVLRKRLTDMYSADEHHLNLEAFCMEPDVSHFIYFPLWSEHNQSVLTQLGSLVVWEHLTHLCLARNRIVKLEGFDLANTTPRLKYLDLSHNKLERMSSLQCARGVMLASLSLEGNPLCSDYTDPVYYVTVAKLLFPTLIEIDGVEIPKAGVLPPHKQNYCPPESVPLVTSTLDILLPLWQGGGDQAGGDCLIHLYHDDAILSVSYAPSLRYTPLYRCSRALFSRARSSPELDTVDEYCIRGNEDIARHLGRFPSVRHDLYTTLVDVIFYNEESLILRVSGVLKVTSETLAEDEPLLLYTRTLVLRAESRDWRIHNEMIYWDAPSKQCATHAFSITTVKPNARLSLKLESPPDDFLKENLKAILMKITKLDRMKSERCLELRGWNLKAALEYFIKLLKVNSTSILDRDVQQVNRNVSPN